MSWGTIQPARCIAPIAPTITSEPLSFWIRTGSTAIGSRKEMPARKKAISRAMMTKFQRV